MITPEQFMAEIRTIAEKAMADEGGIDYVYTEKWGINDTTCCRYVHQNDEGELVTGCIIGRWAHETHGVPLHQLRQREGLNAARMLADLGLDGRYWTEALRTPLQRMATAIQGSQDRGLGWLETVNTVEKLYTAAWISAVSVEEEP